MIYRMEKLSTSDIITIVGVFRETPEPKTIDTLAKCFSLTFGDICRILAKEPDLAPVIAQIRARNREERAKAIVNRRIKAREQAKERLIRRREALYSDEKLEVSPTIVRQVKLMPRSKDALERLKVIFDGLRKYSGWIKRIAKHRIDSSSKGAYEEYVAKYNEKYGLPEKLTTKAQQVYAKKMVGTFKSQIQNTLIREILAFPFQGTHKTKAGKETTGNAKIIKKYGKWRLKVEGILFSIWMPESNNQKETMKYDLLRKYFEETGCPSGEILLKQDGVYANFSLERPPVLSTFEKKVYIVCSFIRDKFAITFFQEGKKVLRLTRSLDKTYLRARKASEKSKEIITSEIISITNEVREKANTRFPGLKHVFILTEPYRVLTQDKEWNNFLQRLPLGLLKREFISHVYNQAGLEGEVYTSSYNFLDENFSVLKSRLSL